MEDFRDIASWLAGEEKYFLQAFKDSGDILAGDYSAYPREKMEEFRAAVLPFLPNTEIRGMD